MMQNITVLKASIMWTLSGVNFLITSWKRVGIDFFQRVDQCYWDPEQILILNQYFASEIHVFKAHKSTDPVRSQIQRIVNTFQNFLMACQVLVTTWQVQRSQVLASLELSLVQELASLELKLGQDLASLAY